jgi:quercetin dioxygenase-like cupin family protein
MLTIQTQDLALADIDSPHDPTRVVRATFPLHWQTGACATAMVYFELEPGRHLGTHTDSAEEVLVVLEGEVEATVGDQTGRVSAGGVVLVPAMAPHDVRSVGERTARVCGIFAANATVSVFEQAFSVMGAPPSCVIGTPPAQAASADETPVAGRVS